MRTAGLGPPARGLLQSPVDSVDALLWKEPAQRPGPRPCRLDSHPSTGAHLLMHFSLRDGSEEPSKSTSVFALKTRPSPRHTYNHTQALPAHTGIQSQRAHRVLQLLVKVAPCDQPRGLPGPPWRGGRHRASSPPPLSLHMGSAASGAVPAGPENSPQAPRAGQTLA